MIGVCVVVNKQRGPTGAKFTDVAEANQRPTGTSGLLDPEFLDGGTWDLSMQQTPAEDP